MKGVVFFAFILFFVFSGCQKKSDNDSRLTSIKAGKNNNMIIQQINVTLVGEYYSPDILKIDVNGDNVFDISFKSDVYGSPGMGMHARSEIKPINPDLIILHHLMVDTFAYHYRKSIANDSSISITKTYYYNNVKPNDSILSISAIQQPWILKYNEDFSVNDDYRDCTIRPYEEPYVNRNWFVLNGIYYYETIITYLRERPITSGEIHYLGFKLLSTNQLGWFKFSIPKNHFYGLTIIKCAIQR